MERAKSVFRIWGNGCCFGGGSKGFLPCGGVLGVLDHVTGEETSPDVDPKTTSGEETPPGRFRTVKTMYIIVTTLL